MEKTIKVVNPDILENYKRFLFVYGNRGGGKSTTITHKIIWDTIRNPKSKTLVVRKTKPSLELTVKRLIMEELEKLVLPYVHTGDTIRFLNGALIDFQSLYLSSGGRNERIKSATYDRIWAEEATELTLEDFHMLNEILRGNHGRNQMILTFNPPARNSNPIYKWWDIKKKQSERIFFDNRKNPYLKKEYIEELESLKDYDYGRYERYALGKWGVDTEQALIYPNWDEVQEFPECDEIVYGLDFGFNNPTALMKVGIKERDLYLQEMLYETHLTNSQLIERLLDFGIEGSIYADAAEPARIEEISAEGFNIYPANKKVGDGINKVKEYHIHIYDSPNLIDEIKEYTYKKDRNGNILEDPVKFRDHLMDAMRYAVMGIGGIGAIGVL